MKLQTNVLAMAVGLAVLTVAAFAQDARPQPDPDLSSTILGPSLMAWTEMQKPEPVPQPAPKPVPLPDQQPEQQPANPQPGQPANSQSAGSQDSQAQPPSAVRTLTGTIIKAQGKYVLQTSDNTTYQIDDQEKAKQYAGKHVKIVGSLDVGNNTIHVESIELIS